MYEEFTKFMLSSTAMWILLALTVIFTYGGCKCIFDSDNDL